MPKTKPSRRGFSLADANAALPLVRSIATDVSQLATEINGQEAQIRSFRQRREETPSDLYDEELREIENSLREDREQLLAYADELQKLGLQLRSAEEGLVDFPSWLDGKPVVLSWKVGEPRVAHWHDVVDASSPDRRSVRDLPFEPGPPSDWDRLPQASSSS